VHKITHTHAHNDAKARFLFMVMQGSAARTWPSLRRLDLAWQPQEVRSAVGRLIWNN